MVDSTDKHYLITLCDTLFDFEHYLNVKTCIEYWRLKTTLSSSKITLQSECYMGQK